MMAFGCLILSGCRSSFPASLERDYQECLEQVKTVMVSDGYTLEGQSRRGGYHDKETYSFANPQGEKVQFTLEVHRSDNGGYTYIDEVNVSECSTSNVKEYEHYCGEDGVPNHIMKYYLKKNTLGSKFSVGKTIWTVIGGSFLFGVLLGVLQASTSKY